MKTNPKPPTIRHFRDHTGAKRTTEFPAKGPRGANIGGTADLGARGPRPNTFYKQLRKRAISHS